jgi:predicted porin
MKKTSLAMSIILALASVPALAQSSVTLYGIADTGIEYFTHATPRGGAVARMPVIAGGDTPSRWGLKGSEDLGNGIKAIFTLEDGFSMSNGVSQQGARLFGRQAFVGLSSRWGQLTLGRQYTMTAWGMAKTNIIGAGGFGGLGSIDSTLLASRADDDVVYMGKFSGVTVGASYSFGRDSINCPGQAAGNSMACRDVSLMLGYEGNGWGGIATYDEERGGPGATPVAVVPGLPGVAFTKTGDTDRHYQLSVYADVDSVSLGAGWLHRVVEGDTQSAIVDIEYLSASVPYNAWTFDAQIARIDDRAFDANGTMGTLRVNYNLSKRTAVYVVAAYMQNNGKNGIYSVSAGTAVPDAPHAGSNQLGAEIGIRHNF